MNAPEVIWQPHPGSQSLFLSCPYDELLYHGTRGPGKTDALLMDYAQFVGRGFGEDWRGILFRETYKQLADVVAKTKKWFHRIFPEAKFNESDYRWTFPDGEVLLLRYMAKAGDYWEYHGHEYPWIGWEELTNWHMAECYELMFACSRSTNPDVPRRIRSTCNPWGPGHHWVKRRFIDATDPGIPLVQEFKHPFTHEIITQTRAHIYGSVYENIHLMDADPEYLAQLMGLRDENMRKAWLSGLWDIVAGGFFADLWDPLKHQIRNWTPPADWETFTSFDWGSASPFSLGLWTVSDGTEAPDGCYYPRGANIRFDELYGADPKNDYCGLRLTNQEIGKRVAQRMKSWEDKGVKPFSAGVGDPSIWKTEGGPSIYAQTMEGYRTGAGKGRLWDKADNQRPAGWQQFRSRLEGDDEGRPLIYVMDRCRDWIRTVPFLPRDDKNWDDVDTETEDHPADETRYAVMRKKIKTHTLKLVGA